MIITYFNKKKKGEGADTKLSPEEEKRLKNKFFGLIPAVGSVLLFVLTENMKSKMVWVDKWTIPMAAILVVGGVVAYLTRSKKPEKAEETENAAV